MVRLRMYRIFIDRMLDVLEREVAPTLLDCSLDSFDDTAMILKP